MKKIYYIVIVLLSVSAFGQKLFISKRKQENSAGTAYFSRINTTDGSIMNDYNLNQPFYYDTHGPIYDSQSNSIYAFKGNTIFKYAPAHDFLFPYNGWFGGSLTSNFPYAELIVLDNRLFATKIYNTSGFDYEVSVCELNKTTGAATPLYSTIVTIATNGYGATFSSASHELFVVVGNNLIKYNINTQNAATFNLGGTDLNTFYPGIICAQNRLFVRKRDYANNQARNAILEINKETGAIIATHVLTTTDEPTNSLVYLASTREIAGLYYNSSAASVKKILKYNIDTQAETMLNLPDEINTLTLTQYYKELVSTDAEELLATTQFQQPSGTQKIKAVYNLLGQPVPFETYDQILIVVYENGEIRKQVNVSH